MTEEENKQRMHDLLVEIETLEKDNFQGFDLYQ